MFTKIHNFLFRFWLNHFIKNRAAKQAFPKVLSTPETIDYILEHRASVARFGDGELLAMIGYKSPYFQPRHKKLAKELRAVASSDLPSLLVCLPDVFDAARNQARFVEKTVRFWQKSLALYGYYWKTRFPRAFYGDALMTRFYIILKDKSQVAATIQQLQTLWQGRDVVFVEGEQSRLGVGNDLFDQAASIQRILAPSLDAYSKIDEIEQYITANLSKDQLILLALGPTATVLAWRLAKAGFQAIDIGHVDIEYEWFRMKATKKVPVPNKFVNEVGDGRNGRPIEAVHEKAYQAQIIQDFSK